MYMRPFHSRNDSGELDVFEASRYFAGAAELSNGVNLTTSHKGCDQKPRFWRPGGPRMSLDMPNMRSGSSIPSSSSLNGHHHLIMENKQSTMVVNVVSKEKKHKQQPSSPGGKLASFLNSLFNQTSSSKKKKSSMKDNDESPGGGGGGRRRRRSSISHFRGSSTTTTNHHHHQKDDTKSANTPIKVITIPSKIMMKPSSAADHYAWLEDNKFQWDRKHRIYANGYSEQKEIITKKNQLLSQVDHYQKHDDDDDDDVDVDGVDEDERRNSDSSSDLFELQNYNLGYDSCGLPVYETTNMDSIKISPLPISSGAK